MARPIYYDIHETQVQAFIREGGEVRNLMNKTAREAEATAKLYLVTNKYGGRNGSHVRSGRLLGGTYHNRTKDTGPLTAFFRLGSSAKHAQYFIKGTGPILGKGPHGYMLVPRKVGVPQRSPGSKGAGSELYAAWNARGRKGRKGFFQKDMVQGQRGKPYLSDARRAAMAANGLVLR